MQKEQEKHSKDTTWLRLPLVLLQQKELSLSAKVIYSYMLQRFMFFVKAQEGVYFESQETIAASCGVSRKTVNESIQSLVALKYISYTKNNKGTCSYVVKDTFKVYKAGKVSLPYTEEEDAF